jgi:hypothetical protein
MRCVENPALLAPTLAERGVDKNLAKRADAADRANQRPAGRPKTVYDDDSGVHNSRPSGNSTERALRRLRKDRPDIHARVLAGEVRLADELRKIGSAKGTRGQIKKGGGKGNVKGGLALAPPLQDVPSLAELKIQRRRAARAKLIAQAEYVIWRDKRVVPSQEQGAPGRGKRVAVQGPVLPDGDPGKRVIARWRKRLCTKRKDRPDIHARVLAGEVRLADELRRIGSAKGTRGQLRGGRQGTGRGKFTGSPKMAPPVMDVPSLAGSAKGTRGQLRGGRKGQGRGNREAGGAKVIPPASDVPSLAGSAKGTRGQLAGVKKGGSRGRGKGTYAGGAKMALPAQDVPSLAGISRRPWSWQERENRQ